MLYWIKIIDSWFLQFNKYSPSYSVIVLAPPKIMFVSGDPTDPKYIYRP
jgi:hypothetical protein